VFGIGIGERDWSRIAARFKLRLFSAQSKIPLRSILSRTSTLNWECVSSWIFLIFFRFPRLYTNAFLSQHNEPAVCRLCAALKSCILLTSCETPA
jgi:hypothetical protein